MVSPASHATASGDLLTYATLRPPEGISERLRSELMALREVPGLVAAAVTRRDGLAIQHTMRSPREAARLCAMAAAMVGASRSTGEELNQGGFLHGITRFDKGILVVQEAGPQAILACLLQADVNLGLSLMGLSRVARDIEAILEVL